MVFLIVDALKVSKTLKLVKDTHEFPMARMELLHLKLFSLEPVSAKVAINLELRTSVLQVLLNSFEGLDGLRTAEALDFEALALDIDVLLKIFEIDTLLDLIVIAPMQNFNLSKHLIQKFILNLLEDGSINEFSRSLFGVLLIDPVIFCSLNEINVLHLKDLAAWALFLRYPLSILVRNLELT